MKKFALLVYTDNALLDALPPGQLDESLRECFAHTDELRGKGRLLDAQMLADAATARSVRVRGGRRTIVDGPFTETKELLAGFNLIEAESMEEAVRMAMEFPWVSTGCMEVREVKDLRAVRKQVTDSTSTVG